MLMLFFYLQGFQKCFLSVCVSTNTGLLKGYPLRLPSFHFGICKGVLPSIVLRLPLCGNAGKPKHNADTRWKCRSVFLFRETLGIADLCFSKEKHWEKVSILLLKQVCVCIYLSTPLQISVFLFFHVVSAKVSTFADLCFSFFPLPQRGSGKKEFPSKVFVETQRLSKTLGTAKRVPFKSLCVNTKTFENTEHEFVLFKIQ
jgi:hypothetical protein